MNIEEQISWIQSSLKQQGLSNSELIEEYTDHYLSAYEYKLATDSSHSAAQEHVN